MAGDRQTAWWQMIEGLSQFVCLFFAFLVGQLQLEAEAGKEQTNLPFELAPVVAKQCGAKHSLHIGGDDLGHTLGVKFRWQFTGVFGGSQAVRKRADKGRSLRLNELL